MAYNNETLDSLFKRDLTALEKRRLERREFCEGLTYEKLMQSVYDLYQKKGQEFRQAPTHIALSEEIRFSVERVFSLAGVRLAHEKDQSRLQHSDLFIATNYKNAPLIVVRFFCAY